MNEAVTLNDEQRLYVIPTSRGGYTCLGYDYAANKARAIAEWLGLDPRATFPDSMIGSLRGYDEYCFLVKLVQDKYRVDQKICPIELTPQLIGLEGKRVEVVDCDGQKRRFYVGRSNGWIPVHLEIARRNSSGGCAVTGAPFQSVRVIEEKKRY